MKITERIDFQKTSLYSEVSVTDSDGIFLELDWWGAGPTLLGKIELDLAGDKDEALKFLTKLSGQVQAAIQALRSDEDDGPQAEVNGWVGIRVGV